ncbi:energy-coupling factor ABC transporter ATP-binding protein (plasmid) [Streptomyces sp. NBC_01591]|uniref:energy-coupling factor ABC transporter ATP-binding protein n=1 Tax=Streptomyces sp. NBC_01591 TaxID=2975888 RepID=UPI002DD80621|nr:ABC transporter ATP-binding protein [Streptomyces sp. NBC_01591]WSD74031.1 energy-coupling factor ABC transporter ATP-binding protein [Streptomyces sp. NBC_01591]
MIEFEDLSYAYPTANDAALRSITLTVPAGQICGVVGAAGAGKTTLAGAISGTIPHLSGGELVGQVKVGGRIVPETPVNELAGTVGMVLQNPFNQISGAKFTVREELAFGLENLGVAREEMIRRVDDVLHELRIDELADRSPYELSGGQQQMVALGSMLAMRPSVLVLDEPTSQLDPAGSRLVFDVLEGLRGRGITVVLMEHKLEQLARFADRLLVLAEGRLVLDGPPDVVLADPRLDEWAVGTTRYTRAARLAQEQGLWPDGRSLPVSLEPAVAGFAAMSRSAIATGGLS